MSKVNDIQKIKPELCFEKIPTRGRPKLKLNDNGENLIINLASYFCTEEEIAGCLGVTVETLKSKENEQTFLECLKKGQNVGKKSLRRVQWDIAKSGNAVMAIWLGKQYLGQVDPDKVESKGDDIVEDFVKTLEKKGKGTSGKV